MRRAVGYYRVSTERQRSGLGLEAQRAAVQRFVATEELTLVAEYVEAESGKGLMRLITGRSLQPRSQRPAASKGRSSSPSSTGSPVTWRSSRA